MKISDLIQESHAVAVSKGWHEQPACEHPGFFDVIEDSYTFPQNVDIDRVAALLLMIHSEIGEAWECYQSAEYPWPGQVPQSTSERAGLVGYRLGESIVEGKPEGLIVELADVVIRVADLAGALGLPLAGSCSGLSVGGSAFDVDAELTDLFSPRTCTEQEHFNELRHYVDAATEHLRSTSVFSLSDALARLLAECQRMATYFGLDLVHAVETKMTYNRTRPHRHGGKNL